jgi:hypothetical protein
MYNILVLKISGFSWLNGKVSHLSLLGLLLQIDCPIMGLLWYVLFWQVNLDCKIFWLNLHVDNFIWCLSFCPVCSIFQSQMLWVLIGLRTLGLSGHLVCLHCLLASNIGYVLTRSFLADYGILGSWVLSGSPGFYKKSKSSMCMKWMFLDSYFRVLLPGVLITVHEPGMQSVQHAFLKLRSALETDVTTMQACRWADNCTKIYGQPLQSWARNQLFPIWSSYILDYYQAVLTYMESTLDVHFTFLKKMKWNFVKNMKLTYWNSS